MFKPYAFLFNICLSFINQQIVLNLHLTISSSFVLLPSLISQKMWTRLIKSTSLRLQKKSLCGYRSESNDSVARWLGKKENGEKIP